MASSFDINDYKKYLDPKNKIVSYSIVQLSLYDILFILSVFVFIIFRQVLMSYVKPAADLAAAADIGIRAPAVAAAQAAAAATGLSSQNINMIVTEIPTELTL